MLNVAANTVARTNFNALIETDRIHGSLYTDPAIFAQEMDTIYSKGWVYVAHESEVPKSGDFCTRLIGQQSVIVSRDKDGSVHILYNRCPHRGSVVCQLETGNRPNFSCPYHGWAFNLRGDLIGVPYQNAYDESFDMSRSGMAKAPRIASRGGFIFASLEPEGKSLDQHLGIASELIDMLVGLSPEGKLDLRAGWMKHRMKANWKMVIENQVDGYHAPMVHSSLLRANKTFATVRDRRDSSPTRVRDLGLGHLDIYHTTDYRDKGTLFRWTGGVEESRMTRYVDAMKQAYGEKEARQRLIDGPPHAVLFPNISLAEMNIMVIQPISVDETIQYTTPVILVGGEELNDRTLRRCEGALGPAGFLIADDAEISELTYRGLLDRQPEWLILKRGIGQEEVSSDGIRMAGLMDETTQRGFWYHYRDVMAAGH
jgi:phenylpropionate dioxygenase-like ring-hydroxylating dioxygenase large terminal subunit